MITEVPYFGNIDCDSLNACYRTTAPLGDKSIKVDLNFEKSSIPPDRLFVAVDFLHNIQNLITTATNAIYAGLGSDEEVQFFLNFHKEELDDEDWATVLKNADKSLPIDRQILSVTHLRRIGLYPEVDDYFAILDFGLDPDVSQYLLVVKMNSDKTVNQIAVES